MSNNFLIKARKSPNKDDYQIVRSQINGSSRFLDNYYDPKLHKNTFKTGKKVSKALVDNTNLNKINTIKKDCLKQYQEFEFIQENDFIVSIEHCSNCNEHLNHTHHINNIYLNYAKGIQKSIQTRYPFIKVILKPINNEDSNEVRIGAMEIQLFRGSDKSLILLHSKLKEKCFPSLNPLLEKISQYIPLFNLELNIINNNFISLENHNKNLNIEDLKNLEVNIYQVRHPLITKIEEQLKSELGLIFNSKKKLENHYNLNETKIILEENKQSQTNLSTSRPYTSRFSSRVQTSKTTRQKSTERITSARSIDNSVKDFTNNSLVNNISYLNNNLRAKSNYKTSNQLSNLSFVSNYANNYFLKDGEVITDKERINLLKGVLISRQYLKNNSQLIFSNLPCDFYLIEIPDNKYYKQIGSIIKFNQYFSNLNENSNISIDEQLINSINLKEYKLKRFLTLSEQTAAYVEIFVYTSIFENNEIELKTVTNSKVSLQRANEEVILINEEESNIILKENTKIKGRYDTILEPGEYYIEVENKDYSTESKRIKVAIGENKINVELKKVITSSLFIKVIELSSKSPISEAIIEKNDLLLNTTSTHISTKGGLSNAIEISQCEYLSFTVSKKGYFTSNRYYVRNNKIDKEKKILYLTIILVPIKEMSKVNILLILYNNINEEEQKEDKVLENSYNINFDTHSNIKSNQIVQYDNYQHSSNINITKIAISKLKSKGLSVEDTSFSSISPEIIRMSMEIDSKNLLNYYHIKKLKLNGLQYFGFNLNIFTNKTEYLVSPPEFSSQSNYRFWDIGFLNIDNFNFYELNSLSNYLFQRNQYYIEWSLFIKNLLKLNLHKNLMINFGFDKGRDKNVIQEAAFLRTIKLLYCKENILLNAEFLIFLVDLFKDSNRQVNYSVFKYKIASNIKNYSVDQKFN